MTQRWKLVVWYETIDQAKAAATAVLNISPSSYRLSCLEGENEVWAESGEQYEARKLAI